MEEMMKNKTILEILALQTWEQVLYYGRNRLLAAKIREADLDGWYLFEEAFGISRAAYFLKARERALMSRKEAVRFHEMLSRREAREPLQYILGRQEFMGFPFYVNSHTLIPRQDTEILVETVLRENPGKNLRVLDMCTGSGCIAVSLAALGRYEDVTAADLSAEALLTAEKNARALLGSRDMPVKKNYELSEKNQAGCRVHTECKFQTAQGTWFTLRQSDLFSAFSHTKKGKFDIIVSNPPYIPSAVIDSLEAEVRKFEPRLALDGEADGLAFYRRLSAEAGGYLTDGGRIYFEIGHDQGTAVSRLLLSHGFTDTRIIKDLAGKDRVAAAVWQRGAGEPAK